MTKHKKPIARSGVDWDLVRALVKSHQRLQDLIASGALRPGIPTATGFAAVTRNK